MGTEALGMLANFLQNQQMAIPSEQAMLDQAKLASMMQQVAPSPVATPNMNSLYGQAPAQTAPQAPPAQGGVMANMKDWILDPANRNQVAMGMDLIGQGFDPNNQAAGVGTQIAQGNMMAEQAAADKAAASAKSTAWQEMLSQAMGMAKTPSEQPGLTDFKVSHGAGNQVKFSGSATHDPNAIDPMDYDLTGEDKTGNPS